MNAIIPHEDFQAVKICGAKTRAGTPCKRLPAVPNKAGRCNLHGGKSLAWFAHPNYKHGRYSKYSLEGARLRAERAHRKRMRPIWREFYKWLDSHPEPSLRQYTAAWRRICRKHLPSTPQRPTNIRG